MSTTVRFWASARAAAGVQEESHHAGSVAELLVAVLAARGEGGAALGRILPACSLLVDGAPVGRRDPAGVPLQGGEVVEVLPPFAGG